MICFGKRMNSVESLAEETELALSLWTCYIMELGGSYAVEMNFLMKKRDTILYYSGKPAETQFSILLLPMSSVPKWLKE